MEERVPASAPWLRQKRPTAREAPCGYCGETTNTSRPSQLNPKLHLCPPCAVGEFKVIFEIGHGRFDSLPEPVQTWVKANDIKGLLNGTR
jgi:hypothetical protein